MGDTDDECVTEDDPDDDGDIAGVRELEGLPVDVIEIRGLRDVHAVTVTEVVKVV